MSRGDMQGPPGGGHMSDTTRLGGSEQNVGQQRAKQHLEELQRQTRDTAAEMSEGVQQARSELSRQARDGMRAAADQARETGRQAVEQVRSGGSSLLMQQKNRAAEEIGHLSAAVRRAADTLQEEQDHHLAGYANWMAERMEDVSNYLEGSNLSELYGDVERLARRRPDLVCGGMFLAGLAVSRFLKASTRSSERTSGMSTSEMTSRMSTPMTHSPSPQSTTSPPSQQTTPAASPQVTRPPTGPTQITPNTGSTPSGGLPDGRPQF